MLNDLIYVESLFLLRKFLLRKKFNESKVAALLEMFGNLKKIYVTKVT